MPGRLPTLRNKREYELAFQVVSLCFVVWLVYGDIIMGAWQAHRQSVKKRQREFRELEISKKRMAFEVWEIVNSDNYPT